MCSEIAYDLNYFHNEGEEIFTDPKYVTAGGGNFPV
jgi:hypothetical protein